VLRVRGVSVSFGVLLLLALVVIGVGLAVQVIVGKVNLFSRGVKELIVEATPIEWCFKKGERAYIKLSIYNPYNHPRKLHIEIKIKEQQPDKITWHVCRGFIRVIGEERENTDEAWGLNRTKIVCNAVCFIDRNGDFLFKPSDGDVLDDGFRLKKANVTVGAGEQVVVWIELVDSETGLPKPLNYVVVGIRITIYSEDQVELKHIVMPEQYPLKFP